MNLPHREFKFRAWEKDAKRMWWNVQDVYDNLNSHHTSDPKAEKGVDDDFWPSSFGIVLENENFIIMQWTGAYDADNKPIYEGDILGLFDSKDDGSRCLIIYQRSAFRMLFKGWDLTDTPPELAIFLPWLVIGNIFETPDLLNKP